MSQSTLPTEFGIFYPTGWLVAAFPDRGSAERVRGDLLTGGYSEDECRLATSEQVIPAAEGQLDDASWLSRLGRADEMVRVHLNAAKRGSTFLIIFAPTEAESERVMTVIRRAAFTFAHRYRRFAIEVMK